MTPGPLLLKQTLIPLLLVSAAAGLTSAVIARRSAPGLDVSLSFTVPATSAPRTVPAARTSGTEETAFESLQAAELFAETLTGWLVGPDFVAEVYARAGVPVPQGASVRRLSRAFAAQKRGGQVADVRFHARSTEEARALAGAVRAEAEERTTQFNLAGQALTFRVLSGEPLLVPVPVSPPIRGAVAALVVFVSGFSLVLLWDFLRAPDA